MTAVEVAGIEVRCRQRLQVRFFFLEVGCQRLPEPAQLTLVSDLGKPLLQQLINVCEAVALPVPYEEVVLQVFDHTFNLALSSRPAGGATGPGLEVIVLRQLQEAGVEDHVAVVVLQHSRFMVIDQYCLHTTTEVAQGPNQGLIGMFHILTRCRKDV